MDKITRDKLLSVLSYFSILWLVGYIGEKNNDIVYFHSKQGLILFIYNLIGTFVIFFIEGDLLSFLFNMIFSISGTIFTIIGVYNAARLKKEKHPIIGNIIN